MQEDPAYLLIDDEKKCVDISNALHDFKQSLSAQIVMINHLLIHTPNKVLYRISNNVFVEIRLRHLEDIDESQAESAVNIKREIEKDVISVFKDDY